MYGTTLSFSNMHNHGALFGNILDARREAYQSGRNWNLPESMGVSFDHYDTPVSRWMTVHSDAGRILAGARLTPSTAQSGIYSYLVRDAQKGLLDGLPTDLLYEEAPIEDGIWEVTRGFFVNEISQDLRTDVIKTMVAQTATAAREEGIRKIVALLPEQWIDFTPRINLPMRAAGPVVEIAGNNSQAVWIDLTSQLH